MKTSVKVRGTINKEPLLNRALMGEEGQDKRDAENSGVMGALLKHVYP